MTERNLSCSKPLRNALHQFTWQSPLEEAWIAASYERKRTESKRHSVAVRTLSNV